MRVLVIRLSSLGDVVLTTGPLRWAKSERPDLRISVLTSPEYTALFRRCPAVDECLVLPSHANASALWRLIRARRDDFDQVIDLHDNLRSRVMRSLLPKPVSTFPKMALERRAFVRYRWFQAKLLSQHVVQRYASAFRPLGLPTPRELEKLRPSLERPRVPDRQQYDPKRRILLHPFAKHRNKEWPYFAELASRLMAMNYQVTVIGRGHFPALPGLRLMTQKTSLEQLMQEITETHVLVSTDSGPLHLGVALNTPAIGIFGPTTREFGFFPSFKGCQVIENEGLSCRPCHIHGGSECPLGHQQCLRDIPVERVWTAIHQALDDNELTAQARESEL